MTIIYDTMPGRRRCRSRLAEGVIAGGCDAKLFNLHEDERSETSSTSRLEGDHGRCPHDQRQPYPSIGDLLYYRKGLLLTVPGNATRSPRVDGREGGASVLVAGELETAGFTVVGSQEVLYVPRCSRARDCVRTGKRGQRIKADFRKW